MEGLSISAAGMIDAQRRLDVAAHNIANVQTPGFHAVRADSVEISGGDPDAASVTYGQTGALDPAGPAASVSEIAPESNVDLATETVNMLLAKQSFLANVSALRAQDETLGEILNFDR